MCGSMSHVSVSSERGHMCLKKELVGELQSSGAGDVFVYEEYWGVKEIVSEWIEDILDVFPEGMKIKITVEEIESWNE